MRDEPLPERQRLGVRIVHAKNAHPFVEPEQDDIAKRSPQVRYRLIGVEIDIDDVFIFLRRIFRVAHRAVRPPPEPFRMLFEPRMVGRALHGEIERQLHAVFGDRGAQLPKVVEGTESGVDRGMPAFAAADRIWAADVVRLGAHVVLALAVGAADGMDRRQIEHVEAHVAERRQPADNVGERAVAGGRAGGRAREKFIPGSEGRLRALHFEWERPLAAAMEKLLLGLAHHLAQVGRQQNLHARVNGGIAQPVRGRRDDIAGIVLRALPGLLQKVARFRDLDGDVATSGALDFDIAAERTIPVRPRLDREFVAADPVRQNRRLPAVVT